MKTTKTRIRIMQFLCLLKKQISQNMTDNKPRTHKDILVKILSEEGSNSGAPKCFTVSTSAFNNLKDFYGCVIPEMMGSISFLDKNCVDVANSVYILKRKSKKANAYIDLSSVDDYKNLLRSLNVKNKIKLRLVSKQAIPNPHPHDYKQVLEKLDLILDSFSKLNVMESTASDSCQSNDDNDNDHEQLQQGQSNISESIHKRTLSHECETASSHWNEDKMASIQPVISSANPSRRASSEIFEVNNSSTDLRFENREYGAEVVKLVQKFDTLEKIKTLNDVYEAHQSLVSLVEAECDDMDIRKIVETYLQSRAVCSQDITTNKICVFFQIIRAEGDHLKFKLLNKTGNSLPADMYLSFIFQPDASSTSTFKIQLSLGSESIISNGNRTGLYKLNDSFTQQIFENPQAVFSVELNSGQLYAFGKTVINNCSLNEVILTRIGTNSKKRETELTYASPPTELDDYIIDFTDEESDREHFSADIGIEEEYQILSTDDCLTE